MYEQLRILRKDLLAILAGVAGGTLTSLGCIFGLGRLFGLSTQLITSLLPKSIGLINILRRLRLADERCSDLDILYSNSSGTCIEFRMRIRMCLDEGL